MRDSPLSEVDNGRRLVRGVRMVRWSQVVVRYLYLFLRYVDSLGRSPPWILSKPNRMQSVSQLPFSIHFSDECKTIEYGEQGVVWVAGVESDGAAFSTVRRKLVRRVDVS